MKKILSLFVIFISLSFSKAYSEILPFERCLDLSRSDNFEVQKSLSDFEMQKIKVRQAQSGYYPQGSGVFEALGEKTVSSGSNSYHPYYFEIAQPLFYFGENRFKVGKEKSKAYSSLFDLLEISLNAEKDAGTSYIKASMTKRKQLHIKNLNKFIKNRYDIAQKKAEDSKKKSLDRLRAYMGELDSDYIALQYEYTLALGSLCKTINKQGRDIDGLLPFEIMDEIDIDRRQIENINKTMKDEEIKDALYEYASIFSPSLNKQRYDVIASEDDIKISKTKLYPKLDAVVNYEGASTSNDKYWRLGVRGVYNFLSPSDWHEVSLKKEALNNQKIASKIFERDRRYDLVSAYRKFTSAIEQLDVTTDRVMQARSFWHQTADKYTAGQVDEIDFADACESYDKAQRDRFSQLEAYFISRLEFLKYLGQSIIMQTPTVEEYTSNKFDNLKYTEQNLYFDYFFFLDMKKAVKANNYAQAIKCINDYKSKFNTKLYSDWSLIHFAVFWDNHEMVEKAIAHGSNVNAVDLSKTTPLLIATALSDKEMVELLLKNGADTNIYSRTEKWTPLIRAANKNSLDICRVLLNHGADVNAQTRTGRTALHNAAQNGNLELVKLLVEHGADISIKNNIGWSAEYIVQMEGYDELEDYFSNI